MPYETVRYRPELRAAVVRLAALTRAEELAARYVHWKYESNPYIETPLIYLVTHGDEVVGMRGAYGAKWEVGNRGDALIVPCFGDLVIAPGHRNRGLVTEIMKLALLDLCDRGYPYAFSLSSGSITFLSSRAMGWRGVAARQPLTRLSRTHAAQEGLRRQIRRRPVLLRAARRARALVPGRTSPPTPSATGAPVASDGPDTRDRVFTAFDRNSRGPTDVPLSASRSPRPHDMASLVSRLPSDGRLRHDRSETYFAWRFQDPRSGYRFLYWDDGGLRGYLVLGARTGRRENAAIVDWDAEDMDVRMRLLDAALEWGKFRSIQTWAGGIPSTVREQLAVRRFHEEGSARSWDTAILARPTCDAGMHDAWALGGRSMLDAARWDLRMINSDAY
jgi:hypothetical protein